MNSLKKVVNGNILPVHDYICYIANYKLLIMKYLMASLLLITIFGCHVVNEFHSISCLSKKSVLTDFNLMTDSPSLFTWTGYTDTNGGINGKVVRVTNLNNRGPGSFRHAVSEVKGPRLVVFDVGGIIDLEEERINIRNPCLTVAGQTAPSPGITLIKGDIYIKTHDVIFEHIAVRPGDAGHSKRSGWAPDGISTDSARDVIIRNCSLTWAIDENLTASGPRDPGTSRRISFINNLIAEGLDDSSHPEGPHSKGSLIHDFAREIAVIGNLYAHNWDRNPLFNSESLGVVVNNLIYNPGLRAIGMTHDGTYNNSQISVVGNVLEYGPDTGSYGNTITLLWAQSAGGGRGDAFLEDNLAFDHDGDDIGLTSSGVYILDEKPTWPEGLVPLPAVDVKEHVLSTVGARPWDRDKIDKRITQSVSEQSGRIIDSQTEVGGYPDYTARIRTLRVPDMNRQEWLRSLTTECSVRKDCI